jgi:hypothetical protein
MPDYKREWLDKAEIDYFTPFLTLWLSCNSWYKSHYSDIQNPSDRKFINKIKTDFTPRNHLYEKFKELIEAPNRKGINFRNSLELLHYSLVRASIVPDKIKYCSFQKMLINYSDLENELSYKNLIVTKTSTKMRNNGEVRGAYIDQIFRLDEIYIIKNFEDFFAGLFEIIYTVRNKLVHGSLDPKTEEHEVVKYCYFVLYDLLKN